MITNHYCEKCEFQGLEVFDYRNTVLDESGYFKTRCLQCKNERNILFRSFGEEFIKVALIEIFKRQSDEGIQLENKGDGIYEAPDGSFFCFDFNIEPIKDDTEEGYYGNYDYYNDDEYNDL